MVLADIKSIQHNGSSIYPNYPEDYEQMGTSVHDRFIVTPPRQEVLNPATYNGAGEETTPAVMGEFISKLVLPAGYDTSHFSTKV